MHRAYLVSRCARRAGLPDDGVRDALSAECVCRERAGGHDTQHHRTLPFGHSSPAIRELGVSCLLITTVQASVQLVFPYPIPRPPTYVLIAGSTQLTPRLCAETQGVYPQLHTPRLPGEHVRTRTLRSRSGSENKTQRAVALII